MMLAEALGERSDLQTRIQQVGQRLCSNARVQEGERPPEDPKELLAELNAMTDRLEWLIASINMTNCMTRDEDGTTIMRMIARRDTMMIRNARTREFLETARDLVDRRSQSEIKIRSTVDVKKVQKETDEMSKSIRELDMRIQRINWITELIEI